MDLLETGFLDRYQRDKKVDLTIINSITNPLHPLKPRPIQSQIPKLPRTPRSTFLRTFMITPRLLPIASPIFPQTCHLAKLPEEIFCIIKGFLPPSSAVLLALTCTEFLEAIGSDPFKALARDRFEKYVLLWSIAKELPRQSVCHSCNRLHNNEIALRSYRDGRNGCRESQERHEDLECRLVIRLDWDYKELLDGNFSPRIFNMAMKHLLHYPDCEDFLNALSGECTAEGNLLGWVKESQTDCRIFWGSFVHRTQMAWITATDSQTPFGLTLEQCAHTRVCYVDRVIYTKSYGLSRDDDDAESQSVLFDCDSPEITLDLVKCRRCSTQCQLTMKPLAAKGSGIAIYITRWADLGSGTLDEKWQRYFQRGRFEFKYQQQPDGLFLSSAFENDGGFRSKIEDQRYASLFHSSAPKEPVIDKHEYRRDD
ncbi:hypothetical protein ACHAO1_002025 [Botrytis cinerea]